MLAATLARTAMRAAASFPSTAAAAAAAASLAAPRLALLALASPPHSSSSSPSPAAAAAAAAPSASFRTITRRRRKEIRKQAAKDKRDLLKFAALFDPARTAELQLEQTLTKLGWGYVVGEKLPGGLTLRVSLRQHYCAFDVVEGSHYVLPTSERASNDAGFGPGAAAPEPHYLKEPRALAARLGHPSATAFPQNVPPWKNPVRGLVLDKETAARHAAIRDKGWKLVVVPQPLWEVAAHSRSQHYARRDLLLSLTVPLAPFEARPAELQAQLGSGKKAARALDAAATAAAQASAAAQQAAIAAGGGGGGAGGGAGALSAGDRRRAETRAATELAAARDESASGRSRKLRGAARRKVTVAGEGAQQQQQPQRPVG
jgi:hypothetical protein